MTTLTFLAVIVVTAVQSLFGVGVLLFGTPLLLLFGYTFVDTLFILLPISVMINLLQIGKHRAHIDVDFWKKILIYTMPFVILLLLLVTELQFDAGFVVGTFLVFVALTSTSTMLERGLVSFIKYERSYLAIMGICHGATNLGGSLLTAVVHTKKHYSRDTARVTIASAYCTFAVCQILTLVFSGSQSNVRAVLYPLYLVTGILVFFLIERLLYTKIDDQRYRTVFAVFLGASGVLLMGKGLSAG